MQDNKTASEKFWAVLFLSAEEHLEWVIALLLRVLPCFSHQKFQIFEAARQTTFKKWHGIFLSL